VLPRGAFDPPVTTPGRCCPFERRVIQQFVDEDAESVDDAALRGGEAGELFGGHVPGITLRCLRGRELVSESETLEYERVRSEEFHVVAIAQDHDVPRCDAEVKETQIQGRLKSFPDPYRELERPREGERRCLPEELRDRRALDELGDQKEPFIVRQVARIYGGKPAGELQPCNAVRGWSTEDLDPPPVAPADLMENLDRHRPPGVNLLRPVEDRDRADLECAGQPVSASKHRPSRQGQR